MYKNGEISINDVIVTYRTIDVTIARLRKKIGKYGKFIVTKQGFGYGYSD
ncbi:MAG: winged helix-turn-helix domain-containing protein [Bacteroidales bacterium]|nr:winged helix-turn-helix domain-containing protein [Bacteroidales bacterium]